jgi:hypothetical protein
MTSTLEQDRPSLSTYPDIYPLTVEEIAYYKAEGIEPIEINGELYDGDVVYWCEHCEAPSDIHYSDSDDVRCCRECWESRP